MLLHLSVLGGAINSSIKLHYSCLLRQFAHFIVCMFNISLCVSKKTNYLTPCSLVYQFAILQFTFYAWMSLRLLACYSTSSIYLSCLHFVSMFIDLKGCQLEIFILPSISILFCLPLCLFLVSRRKWNCFYTCICLLVMSLSTCVWISIIFSNIYRYSS